MKEGNEFGVEGFGTRAAMLNYEHYPDHVLRKALEELVGDEGPGASDAYEELATLLAVRQQPDLVSQVSDYGVPRGMYGSSYISSEALNAPRYPILGKVQDVAERFIFAPKPVRPDESLAEWDERVAFTAAQDEAAVEIIDGGEKGGAQKRFLDLTRQKQEMIERWQEYRKGMVRAAGGLAIRSAVVAVSGVMVVNSLLNLAEAIEDMRLPTSIVLDEDGVPEGWYGDTGVIFDSEGLPEKVEEREID